MRKILLFAALILVFSGCNKSCCTEKANKSEHVQYKIYTEKGSDIRVVCQEPCPISDIILDKKYSGAKKAIKELKLLIGVGFPEKNIPCDIHLTVDSICTKSDFMGIAGRHKVTPDGKSHLCLYTYEKKNLLVPLTEEHADRIVQQSLLVHEAGHAMFYGSKISYWPQEHFIKMFSKYVSGYWQQSWDGYNIDDDHFSMHLSSCDIRILRSATLPYHLCTKYGFDTDSYDEMFYEIRSRIKKGEIIGDYGFKEILDSFIGQDTMQAFEEANIELKEIK